jgi:tetratricopeptide (TPR) repeat protein
VLAHLEHDLENLRAAWRWACAAERFELCASALGPLRFFFTARARLQEGVTLLEYALGLPQTAPDSRFTAQIEAELAYFSRRLDLLDTARRHAQTALSIARALGGAAHLEIDSLCELAIIGCWLGDFGDSARHAEQALDLAEKVRDPELVIKSKSRLALAWRYLGRFHDARELYEVVLDSERRQGRHIDMLRTLSDLGRLYVDMNEPFRAKALFSEGLELAERHDMPYELGFMWEGLSQCSLLLGDYQLASQQAETALRCTEAVGDSMGVAVQCAELARSLLALGELELAEHSLKRALDIAWDRQEMPEVMRLLVIWAALFIKREDWDRAAPLLVAVAEHPGAQAVHKREAQAWLHRSDAEGVPRSSNALASLVNQLLHSA